jgi:hypothetical protein
MAYMSDELGRREVYVRHFPDGDGEQRISIGGGDQPRWRGDGRELFFVGADDRMMAVTVKPTSRSNAPLELGAPQALFETHMPNPKAHYLCTM